MDLGSQLQKARLAAKLTQEDVAQKLYVTRQTISRWEQNKTLPNIYVLKDLSLIYGVELQYFLTADKEEAANKENKHLHIGALVGSILFNAFFLLLAYAYMLLVVLTFWGVTLLLIAMPAFAFFNIGIKVYIFDHIISPTAPFDFIPSAVGLFLMLPLTFVLSRRLWQFTKHYVRYNIKSVFY